MALHSKIEQDITSGSLEERSMHKEEKMKIFR